MTSHAIKLFLFTAWIICITFSVKAQSVQTIREVFINENSLGRLGFYQDDFDGDGSFEFLTDANERQNFFIGRIENNEIITLRMSPVFSYSYEFKDLRYEDANGDGIKEIYAMEEYVGLIEFDRNLIPADTINLFESIDYQKMLLVDTDNDMQREWVVLDDYDPFLIIDPVTHLIKSTNSSINGRNMLIENMDNDPDLELVLLTNQNIQIISLSTLETEHTLPVFTVNQFLAHDLNHDGRKELIFARAYEQVYVYDHSTLSIIQASSDDLDIDFLFPFNIDQDLDDELILYTDFNTHVTELNTFPLSLIDDYPLPNDIDLNAFLASDHHTPETILMSTGNKDGIAFFNPVSRTISRTILTASPNALFAEKLGRDKIESLVTKPSQSNSNFINIKSLSNLRTHLQLDGKAFFEGFFNQFGDYVGTFHSKGTGNNLLLMDNNYESFTLFDFTNGIYKEFDDLNARDIIADDIDYNGSDELIIRSGSRIKVYEHSDNLSFAKLFETDGPYTSNYIVAQLDTGLTKEIILYGDDDIFILSGQYGDTINHISGLTESSIHDLITYTDGMGNFFMAFLDNHKIYIYNYTDAALDNSFTYSSESGSGIISMLQTIENGNLRTIIAVFQNSLKLFKDDTLIYQGNHERGLPYDDGKIVITEYDSDLKANIITSSSLKFSEYEYVAEDTLTRPYFITDIFPMNGSVLNQYSAFNIQFSEPVSLSTMYQHIRILSTNEGEVAFTVDSLAPLSVKISHSPLNGEEDTISVAISGSLMSKCGRFLDTNLDDLSLIHAESSYKSMYIFNPIGVESFPEINLLKTIPSLVNVNSIRYIPIEVKPNAAGDQTIPVKEFNFGKYESGNITTSIQVPIDLFFDEPIEQFNVPINTFSLNPGIHTFYFVALNVLGNSSDTFFFDLELVSESGFYDKNIGGNPSRTYNIHNRLITSNFEKVKTIDHFPLSSLTHVVGGDDHIYYIQHELLNDTGYVHKFNLSSLQEIFKLKLPMPVRPGSPHLSEGILYFANTFELWADPHLLLYDIYTGEEISRHQYDASLPPDASPLTNKYFLILPGGESKGLQSFDRWNGEQKWFYQLFQNSFEPQTYIYDSLFLLTYGSSEKSYIIALDQTTGDEKWKKEILEVNSFGVAHTVIDTLNGRIFWSGDENLSAFDVQTGDLKWKARSKYSPVSLLLYDGQLILFGSDSILFYDAFTGQIKRKAKLSSFVTDQPVVSNGKLFIPFTERFEVLDFYTLSLLYTENISFNDLSVVDEYVILQLGSRLHIYKSGDLCCNPSIQWTEVEFFFDGSSRSWRYRFEEEPLVINNKTYYQMMYNISEVGGIWESTGDYLAYDNQKIYLYNSSLDGLLADFSLTINDTFVSVYDARFKIVNIDTIILENEVPAKLFEVYCYDNNSISYWIEGIGGLIGNGAHGSWCSYDYGWGLLCHFQNDQKIYQAYSSGECWLETTSILDNKLNNIQLLPNPVKNNLVISDPGELIKSVAIISLEGKTHYQGSDTQINISHIQPGIYFAQINLKNGNSYVEKLIKQ